MSDNLLARIEELERRIEDLERRSGEKVFTPHSDKAIKDAEQSARMSRIYQVLAQEIIRARVNGTWQAPTVTPEPSEGTTMNTGGGG